MLNPLKRWLAPPCFPGDAEKTAAARLMNTVGLYFLLAMLVMGSVFVPLLAKRKVESTIALLILFVLYGVSRYFMFRGCLQFASAFMITTGWLVCAGLVLIGGGITSPLTIAVIAITVVIGLLFPPRIGNAFLLISVFAGLGLAWFQHSGGKLPQFFVYSPLSIWFFFALVLFFMNRTMALVVGQLQHALAETRAQNDARMHAEAILCLERDLSQQYFDTARVLMVVLNTHGELVRLNHKGYEILEYIEAELPVGSQWFTLCVPVRLRAQVEQVFARIVTGLVDNAETYENVVLTKTGQERLLRWHNAVLRDADGNITGTLSSGEDITEHKQAEDLVRLRLELLEFAVMQPLDAVLQKVLDDIGELTGSPIGFYHFVERDQKTLSLQAWSTRTVNEFCQAAGKGTHYPLDQAGVWVECVHTRQPVIHNDYAALPQRKGLPEGHAPVIRELVAPIVRGDNIVAILGVGNKPTDYTADDAHLVNYLADVAWEVVERKRAEEALRQSEAQFRGILDNLQDAYFQADLAGNFTLANPIATWIFGYASLQDMIGLPVESLYAHPQDRAALLEMLHSGQPVRDWVCQARRKDGAPLWVSMNVQFVRDDAGRIIGTEGVVRDISERKQAEERLQQALAEKENLLRELYHRTKNNMQVIIAILQLQAARLQDPQAARLFQETESRIYAMALVHQMLYNRQDLSSVNLQEYIGALVQALLRSYHIHGHIQLELVIEPLPALFDVAIPCGLIVNELVSNALKHAFPEGRAGVVRVELHRENVEFLRLCVVDNGVGLPEGFDVRAATSMGLTLVRFTAEGQLEGQLEFQNNAGAQWCVRFKDNGYIQRV
jgi:PAS domain S-box-containing protein